MLLDSKIFIIILFLFFSAIFNSANANIVNMKINLIKHAQSGFLSSGTILGTVHISSLEKHCGFIVWGGSSETLMNDNKYTINSLSVPNEKLNISLVASGTQPYAVNRNGLLIDTTSESTDINILSDGDQSVRPGVWQLLMHGALAKCQ
jgi:hypothetical protein